MVLEDFSHLLHSLLELLELSLHGLSHLRLLGRLMHLAAELQALVHFTTWSGLVLETVAKRVVIV